MLSLALQACIGTLVSLVEASRSGAIHITTRVADGRRVEMRQDAYRMSADQFSRLADLEWSERPGGIPAGIARRCRAHRAGARRRARRATHGRRRLHA